MAKQHTRLSIIARLRFRDKKRGGFEVRVVSLLYRFPKHAYQADIGVNSRKENCSVASLLWRKEARET